MRPSFRFLKKAALGMLVGVFFFLLLLASPLGRIVDRTVNSHLDGLYYHFLDTGKLTLFERLECKFIYKMIALGGYIVSPEGSAILNHYINGSGRKLYLSPAYIKTSPVITRHLATMRVGQTKRVTISQSEDWRLSYALNPMNIRKEKHSVTVYQWLEFVRDRTTHTRLNYFLGKIRIPDGLVHTLKPKPFMVYCKWQTN